MKRKVLSVKRRSRSSIYAPFVIFRATKDGGPVLRTEAKQFRNINGFMVTLGRAPRIIQVIVEFRRRGSV